MITFRYHVVTLVAVFMALGVGVLFGATFISQNIVDGLEASQARLGDRNEALRGRVVELEEQNSALLAFTGSTRDRIVEGALEDVPAVFISFETTSDETLDAVRQTLALAGSQLSGSIVLADSLDLQSSESRQLLAAVLQVTSNDPAVLSEEMVTQIGTALVSGNRDVLVQLVQADLLLAPNGLPDLGAAEALGVTPVVIMVGGDVGGEIDQRIAHPLLRWLAEGLYVAAAVETGSEGLTLQPLREEADVPLVTVDSVETPLGQAALALGLRAAIEGEFGHYGWGPGATTVLPGT